MVKYLSSTCNLHQNQIATRVFKNVTNGIYGKQINSLDTSVKILLSFLMERHVILTRGVVPELLGATSYLKNKTKQKIESWIS
jgi:hypothetical protein